MSGATAQIFLMIFMKENKGIQSEENRHSPQPWRFCVKSSYFKDKNNNSCVPINLDPLLFAVIAVDKDYRVSYLNKAAAEQIGMDQKTVLGRKITDLYQTNWASCEEEQAALDSLKKKGYWAGENIHIVKNGEKIIVESNVIVLSDVSGKRLWLLQLMRDVTHRKQMEAALRETAARFRTIIEHSPAIITVVDRNYRLVYVNPSIEQIIGVSPTAIMGKRWSDIDMPESVRQASIEIAQRVFATGKSVNWEQTLATPIGVKTLESYIVPEFSENGAIETLMGITVDITEHKQTEKVLKGYSRDLEILVKDATEKLFESERFAAIGQTAGMVGHDIRNPLQAIAGELYLQKCELDCLPDCEAKQNLKQSIGVIEEQATYIGKIVSDLQDFARPLVPQFGEVDFEEIVQNALSTIDIPENIEVTYQVDKQLSSFVTDQDYLKRALTNLISNAVQAMPNGGKLDINAGYEEQKAIITVEDTGEGIPEEAKDKIFKPLFTTKAKGQGFGLAVVKRLTESLGGNVTFESAKGIGTKFTVRIPQKNRTV
jgi:PAS domain S-box-containing protein